MSAWNYRVGTRISNDTRLFEIIECYYNEENEPDGYADTVQPLKNWDDIRELIGTYYIIEPAFTLPILDLDNFPNIYKIDESKI
jgi:hypothetical protein